MNKFALITVFFVVFSLFSSCTGNETTMVNEKEQEVNQLDEKYPFEIFEQMDADVSMLVTPAHNKIKQTTLFAPAGKEISALENLGFKVQTSIEKGAEECNLGKYAAARAVDRATDNGGCAQVRKDPNHKGKFCVKSVPCD